MKKLLGVFIILSTFLSTKAQQYRTDVAFVDSVNHILNYYGGSKVIYVRDSLAGGFFSLYQGAYPVNGISIVNGANSSKWRRIEPRIAFDPTDTSLIVKLGVNSIRFGYTKPTVGANGITIKPGSAWNIADTISGPGVGGGGSQSIQQTLAIGNQKSITIRDTAGAGTLYIKGWEGVPANYGTSYGTYGTAWGFNGLGWQQFNSVNASGRPNVVGTFWSYNHDMNGSRINTSDAAFGFRTETHYETGGEKLIELHLPDFTDTAGQSHRLWSSYIDKTGKRAAGWVSNGDGIGFTNWNDMNTLWGFWNPGELQYFMYNNSPAVFPKFKFGANTGLTVNGVTWDANKHNFSIELQGNNTLMGKLQAAAADNPILSIRDNVAIGYSGSVGRRGLSVFGGTNLVEGETYIDNSGVGPRSLSVWYNNVRRLEIGSSLIQFYNVPIYHDKSIFSLEAFKAGGGSYIPNSERILELESTTKTTSFPTLTTSTRNGFSSPIAGSLHYNSDSANFEFRDASTWRILASREWVRTNIKTVNGNSLIGSGDVTVTGASVESTYTPTITNNTNIGTSSVTSCHYQRVGDWVTVFGEVTIDPTSTGDTQLTLSLPIASGIGNSYDLSGNATNFDNNQTARIYFGGGGAIVRLNASVTTSHVYSFSLRYKVTAP